MKIHLIALALLVASSAVSAQDSCGLRAAQLFSAGKTSEIAALFKKATGKTKENLDTLASMAGTLTSLTAADLPRSTEQTQYSVTSVGLPAAFAFASFRVNALSSQLGLVQLQIAVEPGTECTILAVYLHVDAKAKVANAA